jgi:hypothetical protein
MKATVGRREILRGSALIGGSLALSSFFPTWARTVSSGITAPLPTVSGQDIDLTIARQSMMIDGKTFQAIGVNGTVPAR